MELGCSTTLRGLRLGVLGRLHWSSQVVLTLAGLAVGSLGLRFPRCPPLPPSLGSVEELAIEVDVVQVDQEITEWTTVW